MKRVAVLTDSVACLTRKQVDRYQIRIVPANIIFQGKVYRDWVELSPSLAYEFLRRDPKCFETAPGSPGDFLDAFRELSREVKSILCITLSAGLSVMYDNAVIAKEDAKHQFPQTAIEVFDSRTVTAAEGFVVLEAARAAAEGKSLEEVIKAAERVRGKVKVAIVLETLRHAYRTGRIPKIASQIGGMLRVRPVLTVPTSLGKVHFAAVTRSKRKGVERLLCMMRDDIGTEPVRVAVMYADSLEEGENLTERVPAEFNCVELFLTDFSPLIGYATGEGTLGLAYYSEG